jgi:DNA-binding NtrC family response regulator
MNKANIIVIDDEVNILKMIDLSLGSQNFNTEIFSNPQEALNRIQEKYFDIAFVDLKMQPLNGIEVLTELKKNSPDTTVVLMTAHSSVETAVEAIKKGAYDYISKPFSHKEFLHITERVFSYHMQKKEIEGLKFQINEMKNHGSIITKNYKMREILKTAAAVADSNIPVLIEGDSGTGKELLANFIHLNSERNTKSFIPINCAAIPENLFESELFGHVKGSFTGAIKDRTGRLELADSGTVFFDEVAELPPGMQVKLLRFLQNMEFERIGESLTRKINIRIISATNKNIEKDIETGSLREDFFYRISAVRLKLPALKERKEDIPLLADHFLKKFFNQGDFTLLPETLKMLIAYDWPGNIREFENVIHLSAVLAKDRILRPEYLPFKLQTQEIKQYPNIIPKLDELEKQHIIRVLKFTTNPKQAAKILGISETTLWRKRKKYKL